MTYEEYLRNQGYFYVPPQGGDDAPRSGWARIVGGGDDSNIQFLEGDNEENTLRGYQSALQQTQPTTQPTPIVEPTTQRDKEILNLISTTTPSTTAPSTTAQPTTLPAPKSLDEYLQQQGYEYRPELQDTYAASWGKYRDDGEGGRIFDTLESQTAQKYYQDPTRFIQNRETQFGKGINTFNEGNSQQKSVIDQINSGQLYIAPRIERGRGEDQGYAESTSYELRDSKTGNVVNQQVIPIDIEKGVYSILADDPNSSGFFNNYVSTDPKGFVNPIVSEEQSQYSSRANSSANFIRDSVLATIQMATGAGMLGSATSLATSIGTSLGVTGAGALTVGSAVLGSASSAVLAAVTGGDIVKSAIAGGITAGAGANSSEIGTFIAGGADNITAIADVLKLTEKQITTAITNAVTSGVVSAAVTGTDVTTAVTSTLASSVVGSYTDKLLSNIPNLKDSATLIGNVAKVATKAAVSGTDIGTAITNSVPSIIGGLVSDTQKQDAIKKEIQSSELTNPTARDQAMFDSLKQMFAQSEIDGNSIDASTQYALLAQALPNFVNDFTPTTPLVPVQAGKEGMQKFITQASNDPEYLKNVLANPALKAAIDEYMNAYGGTSPQMDLNYIKELLALAEQDPTYQPYRDELNNLFSKENIQNLIDKNPDLYPTIDNFLKSSDVSDIGTIDVRENPNEIVVEADRRKTPITDKDIEIYTSENYTPEEIAQLIQMYGYQGTDPALSDITKVVPTTTTTTEPTKKTDQDILDLIATTTPATEPVTTTETAPVTTSVTTPITQPTTEPVTQPVTQPVIEPIGDPLITPTTTPSVVPTTTPSITPSVDPNVTPSIEPIIEPSITPSVEPTTLPVGRVEPAPDLQPQPQPKLEPSPVKPTTDKEIIDLIFPPITQPTTEPTTEPTTKPTTTKPTTTTATEDLPVIPEIDDEEVIITDTEEIEKPVKPVKPTKTTDKTVVSTSVIPQRISPSTRNRPLSTGLGIDTNVAALLGTGLPSRPDVSSTSEPYLLGKDDKRKDVWNTESLRGALGI
jgi:hypothetical protein